MRKNLLAILLVLFTFGLTAQETSLNKLMKERNETRSGNRFCLLI